MTLTRSKLTALLMLVLTLPVMGETTQETIFAQRRARILEKLEGGIAVMKSAESTGESFRQNSDLYYLTGFESPECAMILDPSGEKKFILFVQKASAMIEVWAGKRPGIEGAMETFGADTAFVIDDFDTQLKTVLKDKSVVFLDFADEGLGETVLEISKSQRGKYPSEIRKLNPLIHEMRRIKDSKEIADLQKAIDITCQAQIELMRTIRPGMFEYEGKAIINYVYQSHGSKRPGFQSIVGSGSNATILHDPNYERQMLSGELLLVDIGAEWNMYSADVTRTFPVNGQFTKEQREIYNIVLAAEQQAIETARPGVGYKTVMDAAKEVIKEGLFDLGLILDKEADWQYSTWTIHGFGHWLGLDTHDAGGYERTAENWIRLEPGMVFTIEPGIYLHEKALTHLINMMARRTPKEEIKTYVETVTPLFEKYKHIGVRIEDDLLITEEGCLVLSDKAPKKVQDIEKLMKTKSKIFK